MLNAPNVYVFLDKGDGTFQPAVIGPTTVQYPEVLAVADVNGDGKADVISESDEVGQIYLFLGNGDGTLQSPVST